MNKAYYRIRQFIFSRALRLFEHKCPVIINENNCLLQVPKICKQEKVNKVLIVTTSGFVKRKTLEPLCEKMKQEGIDYHIYSDVTPDPTIACIEEGVKQYHQTHCEGFVTVGGGSVMDCGKIIAARVVKKNQSIPKMKGIFKVMAKLPLFIAIPTTAGTGSEVTAAAVVTDMRNGRHYKYAISDFSLVPAYALLDASLTTSLSKNMTATTGMDALTHALEAYTNKFASKYVQEKALQAIKMIFENLLVAVNEPENIEARSNMLLASSYAGIAFTNNFVGYVHALAHGLGGLYGVSHGLANSILLVPVMKHFGESVYQSLAEIADYCGIIGNNKQEKAKAVLDKIDQMKKDFNIPFVCEQLEVKDYQELVERAMKEGNPDYPVPTIWKASDFTEVLKEVTK